MTGAASAEATSICFVTEGHKPREVFAADFRDRVVHHLLVAHQEPLFEPAFIHDSHACRRGRGALAASDRLTAFLRRASADGRRAAWAIHLDVASFFPSIHKATLFDLLCRRTRHPELRWLTEVLLFHDPTTDYRFRALRGRGGAPGTPAYRVPARKSLFGRDNQRGLPIGNLTSQFWANVYLDELDQLAKHRLGCRWYVRYVDDVVMLADSPDRLRRWRDAMADFLAEHLKLSLREPEVEPVPARRGVTFVGWRTWRSHRLVGRQTLRALDRRLAAVERQAMRPAFGGAGRRASLLAPPPSARRASDARADLPALAATLASYSGHLRHGDAWGDWQAIHRRRPWLRFVFHRDGWAVRARWRADALSGAPLARRYRRLLAGAGDDVLVFLVSARRATRQEAAIYERRRF